jgi:cellulose synthase/poly-beta-1,6-N-acetylglucosamine synthase-like glycosyltransferase
MRHSTPKSECVSAIVPARNEDAVIAACVRSLALQQEIAEVLVVDDQSSDRTAEIVRSLAVEFPKVRLMKAAELPAGWVGKNNAVWIGASEARSGWLLFTDADAVHEVNSAARALEIAKEQSAVMVSFSPEQVMETWYEKATIPYVYARLGNRFRFEDVNDADSPAAAANGQFILIRREVYEAVDGHASVATNVLEDVALARRVKGAGYRIWFDSGKGIVKVRMYRSFPAMWEGWKKNLYALMGGSPEAAMSEITRALLPMLLILPAVLLAWRLAGSIAATACASNAASAPACVMAWNWFRTITIRARLVRNRLS